MNSCVLMVEVISEPELRQTTDNLEVANMMVEFPGLRSDDPTARIRAVGWGNLATEISEKYHTGDRIILEGRLGMNVIEMKEGYKEKRAELVISRIFPISSGHSNTYVAPQPAATSQVANMATPPASTPQAPAPAAINTPPTPTVKVADTPEPGNYSDEELDDIPFVKPVYSRTNFNKSLFDSWELAANSYWDGIK